MGILKDLYQDLRDNQGIPPRRVIAKPKYITLLKDESVVTKPLNIEEDIRTLGLKPYVEMVEMLDGCARLYFHTEHDRDYALSKLATYKVLQEGLDEGHSSNRPFADLKLK